MYLDEAFVKALAGRYEIEREIGRGGMAIVYLARDVRHSRKVALKVMQPELTTELGIGRFLQEIAITAPFLHPNIVALYDSGEAAGYLYYVMPYIEGPTLRQLLKREVHLPLDEVVRITKQVAAALDYAHARGVVHRDIKPDNILLLRDHVLVADFGLARAITSSASTSLTSKQFVVGTPEYMSPEQCTPGRELDGRADIYSLACVAFEMIAGVPPFRGASANATMTHHRTSEPPSVRRERDQSPIGYDGVLHRALAKVPADRFRSAGDFARALEVATPVNWSDPSPRVDPRDRPDAGGVAPPPIDTGGWKLPRRPVAVVAASIATLGVALLVLFLATRDRTVGAEELAASSDDIGLSPSRYAVFPVEVDSIAGRPMSASLGAELANVITESLQRWGGMEVVEPDRLREALAAGGAVVRLSDSAFRRAAVDVGAGQFLRVRATPLARQLQVRVALFDTRGEAPPLERSARVAPSLDDADTAISRVIDSLLFPAKPRTLQLSSATGTRSLAARKSFEAGHRALGEWDLRGAEAAFTSATQVDDSYAEALLWLAQVRVWREQPLAEWGRVVESAVASRSALSPRDSHLAKALSALGSGRRDVACREWAAMTRLYGSDFTGWYGLGGCLAYDSVVVADTGRASEWHFRSSYHAALGAYERAFRLLPAVHRSFGGGSSESVIRLFKTTRLLRGGRALPPDTMRFLAYPSWQGDTLAFVPLPASQFHAARARTISPAVNEAVYRQRKKFYDIAVMWRAAYPRSADALEAVAVALEMLGDPSALDSLRRARRESVDPDDRIRRGVSEVWMRVKDAMPDGVAGLRAARSLADSLLAAHRPSNEQEGSLLASIAALTGRANLAAELSGSVATRSAPHAIARHGPALVAYASLGGPSDSLHSLERQFEKSMAGKLAPDEQELARARWLLRAALLSVPDHQFEFIPRVTSTSAFHVRLLSAWRNRDLAGARRVLEELRVDRARGATRSWDITTDGLYAEAAVLTSLGDARPAASWLDPTLDSLAFVATQALASAPRGGALMRAAVLRADLASRLGEKAAAKKWAGAVVILWSGADPFLRPTVARMRRLAR